jgi:hypothetical protein
LVSEKDHWSLLSILRDHIVVYALPSVSRNHAVSRKIILFLAKYLEGVNRPPVITKPPKQN